MQSLQAADRFLGGLLLTALQPWRWLRNSRRPAARPAEVERVLLIKFWGIGSLQLLTPAVRALREAHPGARLELLTLSENGDFASRLGVFDEVLQLDVRCSGWHRVFLRIALLLAGLRDRRYDAVYDFEFFTRFSALVAFVAKAPKTTGFCSHSIWRGGLHTEEVSFNRYWHVARNFRALAGGEDGHPVSPEDLTPLRVQDSDRDRRDRRLGRDIRYVVLNANAGRLSLERRWPRENFVELARRLLDSTELDLVWIGSASERAHVADIVRELRSDSARLHDVCGDLDIGELGALLEGASLVLSNDSGPMHLAAALGAPTLGLFGPETPQMYAPLGPRAEALYKPTVCSPCINVHQNKVANCVLGHPECLENLTVDFVATRALAELGRGASLLAFPRESARASDA